ncbi:hypothetical protein JKF63_04531 [Porcisia hertigi]|uniref:DUF1308 domain-containing protein n=1 Tax=Porcisia hertigi TaxID=2761500 RepID=A0A836I4G5_9TRYP|nr:hypothetical protein JKF63_04531 [Porcisia hertigi]
MDQLYEASPIPLSGDDEDSQEGLNLDVSAHSSGISSRSCSCPLSADVSSAVSLDAPEEIPADATDRVSKDFHAIDQRQRQRHGPHDGGLATSSSPNALYVYLMQLLRVAEDLHARLERLLSGKTDVEKATPASGPACVEGDVCKRRIIGEVPRVSRGSGNSLRCHGAAKLGSRLRKEMNNMRRSVEALRAAGCTDVLTSPVPDSRDMPPVVLETAVACAQCNSLWHFGAIVTCLEREPDVTGVYVPVGGNLGPRRHGRRTSVNGTSAVHKPPFTENMRIEVDVVSCNEHRWIKVKTSTARNLELEAAALDVNGATPFTDMLLALVERSKQICLPHRRVVQVAVVLLHPPPPVLERFFVANDVKWASLSADHSLAVSRPQIRSRQPHARLPTQITTTWLPPLARSPEVICLDTTALVTLCSQSCYVDGLPHDVRMERLAPFHVLQEQQRKEDNECHAVVEVVEPALRLHTAWCTRNALDETMRRALLSPCEDAAAGTTPLSDVTERSRVIPAVLLLPTELDWLGPLEKAARERFPNGAGVNVQQSTGTATPSATAPPATMRLDESSLLIEYSGRVDGAGESASHSTSQRPNWIMADVTHEEFKWILETIAGPQEVARAARLLRLVSVVDTTFLRNRVCSEVASGGGGGDDAAHGSSVRGETALHFSSSQPPPLFTSVEYLRLSGKVSLRNKVVFGLADAVNAVIVTSNEQLCHAAREQGVHLEACFHPSRSLTEQKIYRLPRRQGPGKPPAVTLYERKEREEA